MKRKVIVLLLIICVGIVSYFYYQSKQEKLTPLLYWQTSDESSLEKIDHNVWQIMLENYVDTEHESGVHLFDYSNVEDDEIEQLAIYIKALSMLDPRKYRRLEQKAYWINLYNALTVKLILDNYPLESITKLGNKLTAFGPWDDHLITLEGKKLSLNDIEHKILRSLWKDPRIHFAVNCASYGCPNLQVKAFTSENIESLLDKAATEYLTHPRGHYFDEDELVLSSIFDWYAEDFGVNEKELLNTLSNFLSDNIGLKLKNHPGSIRYEYDWGLNDVELFE